MSFNAQDFFPYNQIKPVTVDGQAMVRIPRIYVKNEVLQTGPYKGKFAYFMSETKGNGFHVHPAFMNGGVPAVALDLSCYIGSRDPQDGNKIASIKDRDTWRGLTRIDAERLCNNRNTGRNADQKGWHCWSIYDQHLLGRLMIFELGTTGFGFPTDGHREDCQYRGIHFPAGDPVYPMWISGISNINDHIYIYDMNGGRSMVDTGLKAAGDGYPATLATNKGSTFDLGDLFIAATLGGNFTQGSVGSYQRLTRRGVSEAGFTTSLSPSTDYTNFDPQYAHGVFALSQDRYKNSSGWVNGYGAPTDSCGWNNESYQFCCRLARWVMA